MSDTASNVSGWVTAGIATIIATLSSAVAFLFRLRENENATRLNALHEEVKTISEKADKCEEERGELRLECGLLRVKLESLEAKITRIDAVGTEFSHRVLKKDDKND